MADELFGDRRKALEEAFFAKQNERVKQQLRAKQEGQARREALAAASGIRDEGVLDQLVALGLGAETLAALSLVPLVEVAWADGTIDAKERAAILAGIEKQGHRAREPRSRASRGMAVEAAGPPTARRLEGLREGSGCQSRCRCPRCPAKRPP